MLRALKPFHSLRQEPLPWIGQVPAHWEVRPAFGVYSTKTVKNVGMQESTVLSLSYGQIKTRPPEKLHGLVPESFETYQIVDPGDIIVRTTDLQNDRTSLRVGISPYRGIITSAYMCLRARAGVDPGYAHLLLHAYDLLKVLYAFGSGLRQNLDFSHIKRLPLALPPPDEQRAIVRFLDHVDRKVRKYVRAKQKLIKLLEEQKQAIIDQAVTRGLDPNVKLEPSGVECLGDVPLHWNVSPLKTCVAFQEGPGIMRVDFRDAGVPLLRIACLLSNDDPLRGCNFLDPDMVRRKWAHFAVQPGDYIVNASTSASTILICRAKEPMFGAIPYTGLIRLWPRSDEIGMEYVGMLFQARVMQEQLLSKRSGVGIAHFGPSHLNRVWIAFPPRAEQETIVLALKQDVDRLEAMKRVWTDQVQRVRELQTRLISDIVTGKLDVREAAAALADRANEPADALEEGEMEAQDPEDADMDVSEAEEVAE